MHKHVRTLGEITETDRGRWRKLLQDASPCEIHEITFEPIANGYGRMVRCTVNFDGDVDIDSAKRVAQKTGLMYVEFSDFHREVPMAISGV